MMDHSAPMRHVFSKNSLLQRIGTELSGAMGLSCGGGGSLFVNLSSFSLHLFLASPFLSVMLSEAATPPQALRVTCQETSEQWYKS